MYHVANIYRVTPVVYNCCLLLWRTVTPRFEWRERRSHSLQPGPSAADSRGTLTVCGSYAPHISGPSSRIHLSKQLLLLKASGRNRQAGWYSDPVPGLSLPSSLLLKRQAGHRCAICAYCQVFAAFYPAKSRLVQARALLVLALKTSAALHFCCCCTTESSTTTPTSAVEGYLS